MPKTPACHRLITPQRVRMAPSLALAMALSSGMAFAAQTQIAVAANFAAPMKRLVADFTRRAPHQVQVISGSTGKLFGQITHGAPFDVLLAADQATPKALVEGGFAVQNSQFTYAEGRLIFWSPKPNTGLTSTPPWTAIRDGQFKHIAVANPKLAPFGAATSQAMRGAGMAETSGTQLVYGENVAQVYQFVASGAADAGFLSLSQVWADGRLQSGYGWLVPLDAHLPIRQDAVLLKYGEKNTAARAFLTYLSGPEAAEIIRQFGYLK